MFTEKNKSDTALLAGLDCMAVNDCAQEYVRAASVKLQLG